MKTGFIKKILIIVALFIGFFIAPAASNAAGAVLISEIMYDLAGSDTNREWVEIYNSGIDPVTIIDGSGESSWRFNDGSDHILKLVQGNLTIISGGVAVLVGTSTTFLAEHPGFSGTLIDTTMSLNNTSDTLKLSSDKGATFFSEITYQNAWGGNGSGKSLEKIDLNGNNEQTNWRESITDGGTPGTVAGSGSETSTSTPQLVSLSAPSVGSGSSSSVEEKILIAEAGLDIFIEKGKPIALNGLSSIGADSYKWYLGDGAIKDGAEITYTYQFPGTYVVTLEVGSGEKLSTDQLRVFVFGGKAVINEFFVGNSSTTGQWIEIYNPNKESLDLSGWILSSGSKNFVVPAFVIIPEGGYLVFSQQVTGLDVSSSNKISIKYPTGLATDEVSFDKNMAGYSANRAGDGFFWSKEITPGKKNIVLSSGGRVSDAPTAVPNMVVLKSDDGSKNYIASFYSSVENPKEDAVGASVVEVSGGFIQKLLSSVIFWVITIIIFGIFSSMFYFKLSNKSKL